MPPQESYLGRTPEEYEKEAKRLGVPIPRTQEERNDFNEAYDGLDLSGKDGEIDNEYRNWDHEPDSEKTITATNQVTGSSRNYEINPNDQKGVLNRPANNSRAVSFVSGYYNNTQETGYVGIPEAKAEGITPSDLNQVPIDEFNTHNDRAKEGKTTLSNFRKAKKRTIKTK